MRRKQRNDPVRVSIEEGNQTGVEHPRRQLCATGADENRDLPGVSDDALLVLIISARIGKECIHPSPTLEICEYT